MRRLREQKELLCDEGPNLELRLRRVWLAYIQFSRHRCDWQEERICPANRYDMRQETNKRLTPTGEYVKTYSGEKTSTENFVASDDLEKSVHGAA
jgi:hypothetical protein